MPRPRSLSRLFGATVLGLLPLVALAQDNAIPPVPEAAPAPAFAPSGPSLWDLLKPEYLVQRVLQTGIMALRTQVDIKYGAMAVDLRFGQATLSDITVWPRLPWEEDGNCRITLDRLTLRAAPIDRPDLIRFKLQAQGVGADDICLPPDQRGMLGLAGLTQIRLPRATVDWEYDIASAEADVHAFTQIDGVASVDLTADFSYLWIDARTDPDQPEPVAYLRGAALSVENLGIFTALGGMIPPPFLDPVQSPAVLEGMIGGIIAGMNRGAADDDATGDPSALNDSQTAFIDSVKTVWPLFLATPGRLVLETGFSPQDDTLLRFASYESDPGLAFDDLQPQLSLAPANARAILPASLLSQATGDGAAGLDDEARRAVGTALLTGLGAPRNIAGGVDLLTPLATGGDGAAALALSLALEDRDPAAAYRWALIAGAASAPGAAARLDRLESRLPFAAVLNIQSDALGDVQHPLEALQSVGAMRDQAMQRMSGIGQMRSYSVAALWAIMGAAAGDAESADILDQIDERVRSSGPEGQTAWSEIEAAAGDLALQAWLGQNLPARFGGQ